MIPIQQLILMYLAQDCLYPNAETLCLNVETYIQFMPISGYEIEMEHAPIDSTDWFGLGMSFCKFIFNSYLPELPKSLFHVSIYTERAMYRSVCIEFSA